MGGQAVVALQIVFDQELPVPRHREDLPVRDLGASDTMKIQKGQKRRHHLIELWRVTVAETDKDKAFDYPQVAGVQTMSSGVEPGRHLPRVAEATIEAVSPRMIRTDEALDMACTLRA